MRIHKFKTGRKVALIEGDTHISKWVIESDRLDHDQSTLPLLDKYINKGNTVIDVGAFIGDHTEYYRQRVGNTGRVFAFEPNRKAFECLVYNTCIYPNVSCLNVGASDKSETITLIENPNAGATYPVEGGDINCITIDSISLEDCHFIKIDCEGFELKVLAGATQMIHAHKPVMMIEINRGALNRQGIDPIDIFLWLGSMKYTYRNIYEGHSIDGEQYDVICFPK